MRLAGVSDFRPGGRGRELRRAKDHGGERGQRASSAEVAGVWDGVVRATISEGMGTGDTRIEKQEWHLAAGGRTPSPATTSRR